MSCLVAALALGLYGCDRAASQAEPPVSIDKGTADGARSKPTQVAARVNGQELTVHQINERLSAGSGVSGIQSATAAGGESPQARALDHLVDLTLIGQEATAQGLEKDPVVLRQLQAARQDVIARAWAQRLGEDEPAVEAAEVRRYYDEHPMWFAQRRVFHLQELRGDVPPSEHEALLQSLTPLKHADEAGRVLTRGGHSWSMVATHLGSEQLSAEVVAQLNQMKPGQSLRVHDGPGLRLWWLQAALDQPISWSQAQPVIERALNGQRKAERARRELQRLREQARIEYLGEFEPPAARSDKASTSSVVSR